MSADDKLLADLRSADADKHTRCKGLSLYSKDDGEPDLTNFIKEGKFVDYGIHIDADDKINEDLGMPTEEELLDIFSDGNRKKYANCCCGGECNGI